MPRNASRPLVAALVALGASACGGLQFHNDHRLHFTAPRADSTVSAPVTLTWTMKDLPAAARYAVYVDKAPVRKGEPLSKDTDHTLVADVPSVTIKDFAAQPYDSDSGEHVVTVVLVDASGKRIGESAWRRSFRLKGDKA